VKHHSRGGLEGMHLPRVHSRQARVQSVRGPHKPGAGRHRHACSARTTARTRAPRRALRDSVNAAHARTWRAHPWHPLQRHDLLLQQVVEQDYLVLELQARVVRLEELGVLLLQLQPDQLGQLGRDVLVLLQRLGHLLLADILAQVCLYQVLHELYLLLGDAPADLAQLGPDKAVHRNLVWQLGRRGCIPQRNHRLHWVPKQLRHMAARATALFDATTET